MFRFQICTFAGACALAVLASASAAARYTNPALDAELVMNADSGQVLFARHDDAPRHPASLTKMMTLYLLFDNLAAQTVGLDWPVTISPHAASQPRAHLRLRAGSSLTVDDAIKAVVVLSANDVAVAIAEALGGSESQFAELMNAKAATLGMTHTHYENASGLPDDRQVTTADDLAILARHLIYDYPQYYPYFAIRSMTLRGRDFNTHNMLIGNYRGADGIKTGYIDASGYNIVATAARDNVRLIAVVMGGLSPVRRDDAAVDLLNGAFEQERQMEKYLPSAP